MGVCRSHFLVKICQGQTFLGLENILDLCEGRRCALELLYLLGVSNHLKIMKKFPIKFKNSCLEFCLLISRGCVRLLPEIKMLITKASLINPKLTNEWHWRVDPQALFDRTIQILHVTQIVHRDFI